MFGKWCLAQILVSLCLFASADSKTPKVGGPEHKLYTDLFADYTSDSRPVKNASHTVVVTFALSLNQLLDLDEKNQILTTSVWIYEEWTDEMLKWSPEAYEGQRAIMIPATSIWLPDIFIFNTAGANMDGFVNVNGSKVAIQHTGNVRWMVPLMVTSVCAVDVTYFPYDRQTCSIKFGSWIYDIEQLDILAESDEPDLEHYVMNSEYDLKNVSISRGILDSTCCPGDGRHSMVELKIELRRKSLYYDYIVIAPTIMLCVLTLASFLLPCDRGEKMAIGLTVFLTLYVLQLRIADNVPDTNTTPILGVFMLIVMTFNCVSLIMATIVMNIKKRGDDRPCPAVPSWLFGLCHQVFGRVVCTRYLWQDQIPFPEPPVQRQTQPGSATNETRATSTHSPMQNKNTRKGENETLREGPEPVSEENVSTDERIYHLMSSGEPGQDSSDARDCGAKGKQPNPADSVKLSASAGSVYHSHQTSRLQNEGETEMRQRKPPQQDASHQRAPQDIVQDIPGIGKISSTVSNGYIMKRRWFYVAEVVDKFLFLIYLVLLTFSIFTVLFLIPVYLRNDK